MKVPDILLSGVLFTAIVIGLGFAGHIWHDLYRQWKRTQKGDYYW